MADNIFILVGLWVVYFALHSIFAMLPVKAFFIEKIGISPRIYRLQFVVFAILSLAAIFVWAGQVRSPYILPLGWWQRFFGLLFAAWGILIAIRAFKSYDAKAFLGLSDLKAEDEFRTNGLLQYVRHPLYSGSILLFTGFFIYIPTVVNLVTSGMAILYFLIGIQFEEKKLIRLFGEKYLEYKKNTPMLIPKLFKKGEKP